MCVCVACLESICFPVAQHSPTKAPTNGVCSPRVPRLTVASTYSLLSRSGLAQFSRGHRKPLAMRAQREWISWIW